MEKYLGSDMKILTGVILLSLSLVTPSWAQEAVSQQNISNNVVTGMGSQIGGGDHNQANGVGAIVGGNWNWVEGIGVQLNNSNHAQVAGIGAIAIGNYNTAVGIGCQMIGGSVTGGTQYSVPTGSSYLGYGAVAIGEYNTAIGSDSHAIGYGTSSIGAQAYALAPGSVALGAGSVAERADTVSVGRSAATGHQYDRQITNVAPGVYDTDAVNMSQLRSTDNRVNRVGATAFAFSALAPMGYDPKEPTQYSAGLGTYNGTAAVAIGVFHYTKPDVMINAAIGMSNDGWEKAARLGITWKTGGPAHKELSPAISVKPEKENIMDRTKKIIAELNQAE